MALAPNPLFGNNFRVTIDADIGEIGIAQIVFPELLADKRVAGAPLVLRRAATGDRALLTWWEQARSDPDAARRTVRIELLDATQASAGVGWVFAGARPISLGYSPLDANVAALVFETITLAFDRFDRE